MVNGSVNVVMGNIREMQVPTSFGQRASLADPGGGGL